MRRLAPIWLLIPLGAAMMFAWGAAVGFYRVFPYEPIRILKNRLEGDPGPGPRRMFTNPRTAVQTEPDRIANVTADVVMVGDSITRLGRWNEYFPDTRILDRGAGGETVTGVLRRVDEVLARRPKKIFLLVGINDVTGGNTNAEILPVYDATVARLQRGGATIYVQSIFCGVFCTAERHTQIAALNRELAALARRRGAVFIDLAAAMGGPGPMNPAFTHDGLHLTGAGYRTWIAAIKPFIEAPSRADLPPSRSDRPSPVQREPQRRG